MATFHKSYKYRLYPNKIQKEYLSKLFGSCRFVYNSLLASSIEAYKKYQESPDLFPKPNVSEFDLIKEVTKLKNISENIWLYDTSNIALQSSAKNLGKSFSNFFKRKNKKGTGFPKFKSRNSRQSATFVNTSYKLEDNKLKLPKLKDPIKVVWTRDLPDNKICSYTISKESSGKYFVSITTEYIPEVTSGTSVIGIDAGISDLHTLSNGSIIPNIRTFCKYQAKLARYQRKHSKKLKGSKNREKSRIRVAKIHERIANIRKEFLHNLTTTLVKGCRAICIENLNISGMVKNRRLSKHIMDASWGAFKQMLAYKANYSQHCYLFLADRFYPSTQLCSNCGKKPDEKLTLGKRKWACLSCNTEHLRDINAAKNLEKLAIWALPIHSKINPSSKVILLSSEEVNFFLA